MKDAVAGRDGSVWRIVALFLLVAGTWHLPLFLVPAQPRSAPQSTGLLKQGFQLVLQPAITIQSQNLPSWDDPTVYVLPTEIGFSSHLRQPATGLPRNQDFPVPPTILLPSERAGQQPDSLHLKSLVLSRGTLEEHEGDRTSRKPEEPDPPRTSPWVISENLAGRAAPSNPSPVSPFSTEALSPTLLHVAVNADGDVVFVLVAGTSGSDKADTTGLAFARTLRFMPLDTAGETVVAWGTLKILWEANRTPSKT